MRLLLVSLITVSLATAADSPSCKVTLRVVSISGDPVSYKVTSFKDRRGVDFANEFVGLQGSIPCSVFLYTAQLDQIDVSDRVAIFTRISSRISVSEPENWLTLSVNPNHVISSDGTQIGSPTLSIPKGYVWKGRLNNVLERDLWIHIRSAVRSDYGVGETEGAVDATGEFRVYTSFVKGPHILYVINRRGELVYTVPVRVESELPIEPIEIMLNEPPTLIVIR